MTFDVSSTFVDTVRSKSINSVSRYITIGGSDFSGRVLKWPKLDWNYQDIRPKSVSVGMANNDGGLNFFRNDKTLMESAVLIGVADTISTTAPLSVNSFNPTGQVFDPAHGASTFFYGGLVVTSGGEFLIACEEGTAGLLRQYTAATSYSVESLSLLQSFDVQPLDSTMHGVAMTMNGSKVFTVGATNDRLFEFDVASPHRVSSLTLVNTLDVNGLGLTVPMGVAINSDASWMLIGDRADQTITEFTLSTPGHISTLTPTGNVLTTSNTLWGFALNPAGNRLYVGQQHTPTSGTIIEYELPTAGSLTGATLGTTKLLTSSDCLPYAVGMPFDRDDVLYRYSQGQQIVLSDVNSNETTVTTTEQSVLYSGTISRLAYDRSRLTVAVVDKFKQLADRKIGTPDAPADFTGQDYLVSDLAWYVCTSYGGLSALTTSANPDINYPSFAAWAEVFSGDSTRVRGMFDGQSCLEALRKIARVTHSSIFVEAGRLKFNRIGLANPVVDSYGDGQIADLSLSFETEDLINRQLVAGGYSTDSGFAWTVTQANTTSVNSFGPREDLINDQNVWYVTSATAINHAQRSLILTANPDDRLDMQTGMRGFIRSVADTLTVVDSFHGIAGNYIAHGVSFDLDTGMSRFDLRAIVVKNPFRLDVSSLDTTEEVLT